MEKTKSSPRTLSALATLWLTALLCLWSGIASAGQLTTHYTYDEAGNKTSQTDAQGRVTRWGYTLTNQVASRTLPDGKTEYFTYDDLGNLSTHTDFAGQITRYAYDELDRPTTVAHPDGRTVKTTYTKTGQVETVTETRTVNGKKVSLVTRYAYDINDRLLKVTNPDNRFISYGYDLAGNITSRSTVNCTTAYEYDVMNRLAKVTDGQGGVTTYAYDAAGKRTDRTMPNGMHTHWTYNTNDQLTGLHHETAAGALLADYQYTLDAKGQRTGVTESFADPATAGVTHTRNVIYTYDSLDRLTSESVTDDDIAFGGSYSRIYGYDSTGNRTRLEETKNGQTTVTTYAYNNVDQLTGETVTGPNGRENYTYSFDANGNLTGKSNANGVIASYSYTEDNKLLQVEQGAKMVRYAYDAAGNRIQSVTTDNSNPSAPTTQTQNYLVDTNFPYAEVIEEYDGQGQLQALNTFTPDRAGDLLSVTRSGQGTYYAGEDGHGSLRQLTDASGAVKGSETTTAWGEVLENSQQQLTVFGFVSEMSHLGLGITFLRARDYVPSIGVMLQRDSIAQPQHNPVRSLYTFADGNPVLKIDPSGHLTLMEWNTVTSIAGAVISGYSIGTGVYEGSQGDYQHAFIDVGLGFLGTGVVLKTGVGVVAAARNLARYRGQYVAMVWDMDTAIGEMVAQGQSVQNITKWAVERRNQIKAIIRSRMVSEAADFYEKSIAVGAKLSAEARNLSKYGDPIGPTFEQLMEGKESLQIVLNGSLRTSDEITKFFQTGWGLLP